MTTTLTISAPLAMAAVPGLIAIGGVVVGIALNGWLTTGIEVARLNASNDAKTARWLWRNGYRKTPHAGPDVHEGTVVTPSGRRLVQTTHPELLPADPHVTGELLAVDGVDTEADVPHEDTDRPRWWASVVAFVVLAPLAFARRQWPVLVEWLAYRFKSQAARDAEFAETYHRALEAARDADADVEVDDEFEAAVLQAEAEAWADANPPTNPRYRGRHWASDVQHTAAYPVVNPSIPAQRTEAE